MVDENGFNALERQLGEVPRQVAPRLRQAVEVTARNIKDAWKGKLEGANHLPHGSRTITYDLHGTTGTVLGGISAEIGAERGRLQARFIKVVENGAPTLTARGYGSKSLHENEADFDRGIQKAVEDGMRDAGLS